MKKLHIIFYVCMVVLFFGCSRDESDLNDKKLEPISFNSVISEDILTRATGTRWDKGDQIGIFCFKGGETLSDVSILNNYTNIPFYTNGNSTFYADGQKLYYPSNSSSVSFISYYPYKPNLANY
ncbi:MAG: endonuclease, partial [Polaribacter sp.]